MAGRPDSETAVRAASRTELATGSNADAATAPDTAGHALCSLGRWAGRRATSGIDGATVGSSPGTFKASPGLHQMRITRQWLKPWQQTVNIQPGATFRVALELSDAGLQRYTTLEGFRAAAAIAYAEAMMRKGIKINFDTAAWRDVSVGNKGNEINLEKKEIHQSGTVNQAVTTPK